MQGEVTVMEPEAKPMQMAQVSASIAEHLNLFVKVKDADTYLFAAENRKKLIVLLKGLDVLLDPNTKRWHEGWKKSIADKKSLTEPIQKVVGALGNEIQRYDDEQEVIRQQRETIARAAAFKAEEDRRIREAVMLQQEGRTEEANKTLEAPVEAPAVVVPKSVPKVEGQSYMEVWGGFEVVDKAQVPTEYLMIDEQRIRGVIKQLKADTKIAGIRVLPPTKTLVQRTR